MNHRTQVIFVGLLPILGCLIGCTTPVLVDYDREAVSKFDDYKCFVIDAPETEEDSEDLIFSPIATRRFIREIEATLIARGYSDDCPEPDFRVRFLASKKQITELDFLFASTTRFYRYPGCYPGFYPNDPFFPPSYLDRYEQGTLLIDIIDIASGDVVWRGAYTERLGQNPHSDEEIHRIINKILDRFPPEETTHISSPLSTFDNLPQ